MAKKPNAAFARWLARWIERYGSEERPIHEAFWREVEVAATNAEWLEAVEEIAAE